MQCQSVTALQSTIIPPPYSLSLPHHKLLSSDIVLSSLKPYSSSPLSPYQPSATPLVLSIPNPILLCPHPAIFDLKVCDGNMMALIKWINDKLSSTTSGTEYRMSHRSVSCYDLFPSMHPTHTPILQRRRYIHQYSLLIHSNSLRLPSPTATHMLSAVWHLANCFPLSLITLNNGYCHQVCGSSLAQPSRCSPGDNRPGSSSSRRGAWAVS